MRPSDFREKVVTLAIVVAAAVVVVSAVYIYERYYRATDACFYGTWQEIDEGNAGTRGGSFLEFRPDHNVFDFAISHDGQQKWPFREGRWYAGGERLYLRWGGTKASPDSELWVVGFDISSEHLTIATLRYGEVLWNLRRVPDSRLASNQMLQPTAAR